MPSLKHTKHKQAVHSHATIYGGSTTAIDESDHVKELGILYSAAMVQPIGENHWHSHTQTVTASYRRGGNARFIIVLDGRGPGFTRIFFLLQIGDR